MSFSDFSMGSFIGDDYLGSSFNLGSIKGKTSDDIIYFGRNDEVNSPAHYTRGSQEAIDVIEEAIQDAPSVKAGMLQAQALKYLLRIWLKEDSKKDAEKARWYLNRLIDSL